ncbi:hypothetical protein BT69DRAFT_1345972 [Atractiella rhizophila]|nr:hypothetical protein BT69DRAFT_1345972 [Atractiella rhizophila]
MTSPEPQNTPANASSASPAPVPIPHARKERSQSLSSISSIDFSQSSILQKLGLSPPVFRPSESPPSSPSSSLPPTTPPWNLEDLPPVVEGKPEHDNSWDTSAEIGLGSAGTSPSDIWWSRPMRRSSIGPGWTMGKKDEWNLNGNGSGSGGSGEGGFGLLRRLSFTASAPRPTVTGTTPPRPLSYPTVPPPTPAANKDTPLPAVPPSPARLGATTSLPTLEEERPLTRGRRKRNASTSEHKKRKISPHGERILTGNHLH